MSEVVAKQRGVRKERSGTVISKSGDKSLVIRVERRRAHPFYGKVIRHLSRLHVHDESNAAKVGDRVRVVECRPMSRMKRWRLVEVLEAQGGEV